MFNLNTNSMKNFKISCLLIGLVLFSIVFACNKNEVASPSDTSNEKNDLKRNEATWVSSNDYSKGWFFRLKIFVGHTAAQCGNSCMEIFGINGSYCSKTFDDPKEFAELLKKALEKPIVSAVLSDKIRHFDESNVWLLLEKLL
jgi:hypothetical protein